MRLRNKTCVAPAARQNALATEANRTRTGRRARHREVSDTGLWSASRAGPLQGPRPSTHRPHRPSSASRPLAGTQLLLAALGTVNGEGLQGVQRPLDLLLGQICRRRGQDPHIYRCHLKLERKRARRSRALQRASRRVWGCLNNDVPNFQFVVLSRCAES